MCGVKIMKWRNYMKNEIVQFDDFSKIILKNSSGVAVGQALVDNDDIDDVSKHRWHLTNTGYVIGYDDNNKTKFLLHNYVKKPKDGLIVDHINHNPLDCRKENLRYITQSINVLTSKLARNNKTGKKGVYLIKNGDKLKYKASIQVNGRLHNLGTYQTFADAVKARQAAEKQLLGFLLDY